MRNHNEQEWKWNSRLWNAETKKEGNQIKKKLDYDNEYVNYFLECDPLRDWESFDRCKWLWNWAMNKINEENLLNDINRILDCGCKDGKFCDWLLKEKEYNSTGIEISRNYVKYARDKGRPVIYKDICKVDENWYENFDFVFAHHLLGLVPDNFLALVNMYSYTNKYLLNLSQIPGNLKKHYSYMKDGKLFEEFIKSTPDCEVLYNGYLETGFSNEYVLFLKKKGV